ncbi:unnamed protein product [Mytilus edulis]|uniref:Uncharacterized protein n=1 Tax=Mytilus edulis TaxID=6550 RepID=A0A8S3UJJ0_MYTED|nr:unnamed protein product [Mytilus edulis]
MISLLKQHTLILLLAFLCVSNALQCPDISQRKFRQSGICNKINQSYVCLYDENLKKFVEFCGRESEIQRPVMYTVKCSLSLVGFEFILTGNLDGSQCKKFRYQPIRFLTNESSECIFKKSSCNDEGLIVHKEGNSTSDKTCRCDYTRGYAFVDRPKRECYCDPNTEDCSCYRKQCNINQVLTPGNCIFREKQMIMHYMSI